MTDCVIDNDLIEFVALNSRFYEVRYNETYCGVMYREGDKWFIDSESENPIAYPDKMTAARMCLIMAVNEEVRS